MQIYIAEGLTNSVIIKRKKSKFTQFLLNISITEKLYGASKENT